MFLQCQLPQVKGIDESNKNFKFYLQKKVLSRKKKPSRLIRITGFQQREKQRASGIHV